MHDSPAMVCEPTNVRPPLLPDRYPIADFFICDVMDAIPKDDMASMEHPIFSLSTKPDTRIREYEHNGVQITVIPSTLGLATIHDKDVLIYCISQLIAKMNAQALPQRTLHLKAYDLLVATNRTTDGRAYMQLRAALERLSGTRIRTNIRTNSEEITEGFGLIDSWRVIRHSDSGRMAELRVNLSEWVFNAVLGREVLTLHRDYFRLRKPLERRMYELARKHCGQQARWEVSLSVLQKKCGAVSTDKEFRRLVGNVCREDAVYRHMPDYAVSLNGYKVVFAHRESTAGAGDGIREAEESDPTFSPEVYHDARLVAPGYDVYGLEQEWRSWWEDSGRPRLSDPDKAFIGFCRRRYQRQPNP